MKKRLILAGTVAAVAALALTGCTGGGAPASSDDQPAASGEIKGEITFQTWSLKNEKFTPYFEKLVADFEAANPGTTVKWVDQPADGYEDKVLQQAESGELPDVLNLPPEYAYTLAKAGQLADLDAGGAPIADYVDGGIKAYQFDGLEGSYGLPWYLGTELNYWNTDLLAKGGVTTTPTTVDEMLDAAGKLADAGVQTISDVPSPKSMKSMLTDQGVDYTIFKDGEFTFNTPEAVELINKYAELYKAGAVTPEALQGAGTANNNISNFNKGSVAFTTAGPNYIDKDIAVNAPNLVASVAVAPGFGTPPLFVQGMSVSKNSKNAATAMAFIEFATNTENQIEFVKLAQGFFPGTKAANEDPTAFAEEPAVDLQNTSNKLAAAQMDRAELLNPPQYIESMETYAKQQIALAVKGEITAEEALTKAVEYCKQNLVE